jgi:DNA-binding transcriptional MerR regulator/methylmalonyl-CoA mutase cobalamin-binding subunit
VTDVSAHTGALPIAAVERDCGLSKDTLRVWERRYGFPAPVRDEFDERAYPVDQVDRLRAIKRLLDLGHRPGKIIALPLEELHALAQKAVQKVTQTEVTEAKNELRGYLELVKAHQIEELRGRLSQSILRIGLARLVTDVIAPMNELIGDAWARGQLEIFEEHLYTELIQSLLRNATNSVRQPAAKPRVLLTTLSQEPHGLGVLMAQTMFALEGACCISLGVQTPLPDIVLAAQTQSADIVALSFSSSLNPNQVVDGLAQLRARLAPTTAIWVGGACPILYRRPPAGVLTFAGLTEIAPALVAWREAHSS